MSRWQQTGWRGGKPVFRDLVAPRFTIGNPKIVIDPKCRAIRDGQEVYCPCGVRWTLGEDRPECPR